MFEYAVIDPEGKLTGTGYAGTHTVGGKSEQYILPLTLTQADSLGKLDIVQKSMPKKVRQRLWPIEFPESSLRRPI